MFEALFNSINKAIEEAEEVIAEQTGAQVETPETNELLFESSDMGFKKGSLLKLYSTPTEAEKAFNK